VKLILSAEKQQHGGLAEYLWNDNKWNIGTRKTKISMNEGHKYSHKLCVTYYK
jgi:hypothetical protein